MKVYIKRYKKKELWNGKDWTSGLDLAKTYDPDIARNIIAKRWSKGDRQYYQAAGRWHLKYGKPPIIQTRAEIGKWERI